MENLEEVDLKWQVKYSRYRDGDVGGLRETWDMAHLTWDGIDLGSARLAGTGRLIDWLIDWPIDWLIDWPIDWLTGLGANWIARFQIPRLFIVLIEWKRVVWVVLVVAVVSRKASELLHKRSRILWQQACGYLWVEVRDYCLVSLGWIMTTAIAE